MFLIEQLKTQKINGENLLAPKDVSPALIVDGKPEQLANSFDRVCVHLQHAMEDKSSRVVLSSGVCHHSDYSYITTANLAVSLAASGQKTILIDASFRNPLMHMFLNKLNRDGLSGVCNGFVSWNDATLKKVAPNLDFLPAGPTVAKPNAILASESIQDLFEVLANHYENVIIHTPAINQYSDALKLLKCSAGVVLSVVRHHTKHKALQNVIEEVKALNSEVLGIIIASSVPEKRIKKALKKTKQEHRL